MRYFIILLPLIGVTFAGVGRKGENVTCLDTEEHTDCLNPCPATCQIPNPPQCYWLVCNEGCYCKDGFIKSENPGECIPVKDCEKHCGKNQEYNSCGVACPDTCDQRNQGCTDNCVAGCFCQKGYVLEDPWGECIPEEDCPKN